jgi:hypothetical protein
MATIVTKKITSRMKEKKLSEVIWTFSSGELVFIPSGDANDPYASEDNTITFVWTPEQSVVHLQKISKQWN